MPVDIERLLREAFFATNVGIGVDALAAAETRFAEIFCRPGASFEILVPIAPDAEWVREQVVRPLVYFCQSTGVPVPACPNIFVALFVGARLYCVTAYDVLTWASRQLRQTPDDWLAEFGTHERETTSR